MTLLHMQLWLPHTRWDQPRKLACFQLGSPFLQEASEGCQACAWPYHDHWGAHLLWQLEVGMPHKNRYPLSYTRQQLHLLVHLGVALCVQLKTSQQLHWLVQLVVALCVEQHNTAQHNTNLGSPARHNTLLKPSVVMLLK